MSGTLARKFRLVKMDTSNGIQTSIPERKRGRVCCDKETALSHQPQKL